ncbi:hypothetical protein BJY04DRAFT_222596 [Aspergillus karnatakaensis]|uniref:Zn(II)2Cys6 transcription factor n=1 Tax=Aspergillus karnatakaensis TaxID=1810916 RepID=UPI003CCD1205
MAQSLRATQRAPRSCRACSSRKVKCDKAVPCSTCIKRGEADSCTREVVIVRGEVTMWNDAPHKPTYEELMRENQRLRQDVEGSRSPEAAAVWPRRAPHVDQYEEGLERRLWDSLSVASALVRPTVAAWEDIVLPTSEISNQLIAYDKTWNIWVHYAVEYPKFQEECELFINAVDQGTPLETTDPSWMAVYFAVLSAALLMIGDDEGGQTGLPHDFDHRKASRNWYDASIFCLYRADFLRIPHIRTIQAVAVLGMCFNNWGDTELGQHMWDCALRVGQRIGLNTPFSHVAGPFLSAETQHRLWWTLVICDWLNTPYGPTIHDVDFIVPLPSATFPDLEEEKDTYHRAHYHIFMARSATVVYRFRAGLRSGVKSLDEIVKLVRIADEDLAAIIGSLPPHLQPDADIENEDLRRLELAQPWIRWQRHDITLVLLHFRLRIHRTLQTQWLLDPATYNWARTVSLQSAMSIIWINRNWDQPASMRKQWALSLHLFVAAILLLRECHSDLSGDIDESYEALQAALNYLEEVKTWNLFANHAAKIVRENMTIRGQVA